MDGKVLYKTSNRSYGYLIDEPRGENGFGYDPIFVGNDTFGKTYAELDSARKNLKSHRKKALSDLAFYLSQNFKA
jgi:XTP/dITP diphosphohydrolase